jgi:hypothetical protein
MSTSQKWREFNWLGLDESSHFFFKKKNLSFVFCLFCYCKTIMSDWGSVKMGILRKKETKRKTS